MTHDTLMNLHELLVALQKFEGPGGPFAGNPKLQQDCAFAAFALFVPLCSSKQALLPGSRLPPQVIGTSAPSKVKWLCTPMVGSKVFVRLAEKQQSGSRSRRKLRLRQFSRQESPTPQAVKLRRRRRRVTTAVSTAVREVGNEEAKYITRSCR